MPLPPDTLDTDWTNFWSLYAREESEGRRFTILLEGTDEEEALLESLKANPAGNWMDVICFVFPHSRRIGDLASVSTPDGELPVLWDAEGVPYVIGPGGRRGEVTVPVKMLYAGLLHPLSNGSVGFFLGTRWIEVADTGLHAAVQARNRAYGIRMSDAIKTTHVPTTESQKPKRVGQPRRGERVNAEMMHRIFRAPTEQSHIAAINLLNGPFQPDLYGRSIMSQNVKRHMRLSIDAGPIGSTEFAITWLSKKGPSVIQTLYALIGLWLEKKHKFGRPWDEYLEVRVTDLLRYKGRREVGKGGFHKAEQENCGKDIAVLMSMKPWGRVTEVVVKGQSNSPAGRRLSERDDRLSLIDFKPCERAKRPNGDGPEAVLSFQYHLAQPLYESLVGVSPQYTHIPQRLLSYHPVREKYHILLGFALCYHQRTMKRFEQKRLKISLIAALNRAEIAIPTEHVEDFMACVKRAVEELNAHGVIPGAQLLLPTGSDGMTIRRQLATAQIEMDAAPERPDPLHTVGPTEIPLVQAAVTPSSAGEYP